MDLFTLTLSAATHSSPQRLYELLLLEFKEELQYQSPSAAIRIQMDGEHPSYTFLRCTSLSDNHPPMQQIYRKTGRALASYILQEQELSIIRRIIVKEFQYTHLQDIEHIEKYCEDLLEADPSEEASNEVRERRRDKLAAKFEAFLQEEGGLHVEGFLRFRLSDYLEELREIVEYAIDEFLLDKQYQDFISLLKYFVYIQEAKVPVAHLIHKGPGEFQLLNEQMKPMEMKQVEGFVIELLDKDINYEDMIVSSLITVSPERVVIHTRNPEMQVIKTIRQIFEDRADLCTYCIHCKPMLGDAGKKDQLFP